MADNDPHAVRSKADGSPAQRVLIVDDHQTFTDLLSFALSSTPGIVCVGTAHSGAQGVALAQELQPDTVVMDIEMPRQNGLAATRRLLELAPKAVVVVVTAHRDPTWVARATQAGASAFVPKNGSLDELLDVLRRARLGAMLVAPSAFALRGLVTDTSAATPTLTRRERQVLGCLGRAMTPRLTAQVLGISVNTCRGYIKSLLLKLGVSSQLEAVVKAQELGLLAVRT